MKHMKEIAVSLPPLQSISALETLDRLGSIKSTASALNLTQSAVSHKIKTMQLTLGFPLTVAHGRGVLLTSQARQYVRSIRPALRALEEAHQTVSTASGQLTISCVSGFAAYWLAPRLTEFRHLFPDIELHLLTHRGQEPRAPADLAITFSAETPTVGDLLMAIHLFPVCAPDFAHSSQMPRRPNDLNPSNMLHLSTRADWQNWLNAQSTGHTLAQTGVVFDDVQTMLAATCAGQGISLGDRLTSETALRTGALVRPFSQEVLSEKRYYITAGKTGKTASSAAFETWLKSQF